MFNEWKEAQEYFEGKNIPRNNIRRAISFVCRYMHEVGMKRLEARDKLIEWVKENNIEVKCDANQLLDYAYDFEKKNLSRIEYVCVSDEDIWQIKRRFDHKKTRLIAFAMLCFAKAFSNSSREISVSYYDLAVWSGVYHTTICKTIIPEIINYDFAEVICASNNRFKSNEYSLRKKTKYRLLVPVKNIGEHKVTDDIVSEFNRLFGYE